MPQSSLLLGCPQGALPGPSVHQLRNQLIEGEESLVDFTRNLLHSIQERDAEFHALTSCFSERALQRAVHLERMSTQERASLPLFGIPVLVKANIAVAGESLSCASCILEGYESPYSATVVERLESAGAIVIAQTNMDEFAMGSSTEHSCFGVTKNPYQQRLVSGGSSGGAACSASLNYAPLSFGSDTGGSVRQPAAYCGVYGLKPSYGAISRYGLVAFGSSLDQISPVARRLDDLQLGFAIVKGRDERDATSRELPAVPEGQIALVRKSLKGLRVGVETQQVSLHAEPALVEAYGSLLKKLESVVFSQTELSLPAERAALAAYYVLSSAEASSNLSRFDGLRYGKRRAGENLDDTICRTRSELFGREVKRRICSGAFALSAGHFEEYYGRAMGVRSALREQFQACFRSVDLILTLTAPTRPFALGEQLADPIKMYANDRFTVPASLAGLPALNIPVALEAGCLQEDFWGLQLIGPVGSEILLIEVARQLKRFNLAGTADEEETP